MEKHITLRVSSRPYAERPLVIYVEDRDNDFAIITPIIQDAGYRVKQAKDHAELAKMLATYPEAVAIVSDVDAPDDRAGIEWAMAYKKTPDAKPFLLISQGSYGVLADNLKLPYLQKPIIFPEEYNFYAHGPDASEDMKASLSSEVNRFTEALPAWLHEHAPLRKPAIAPSRLASQPVGSGAFTRD